MPTVGQHHTPDLQENANELVIFTVSAKIIWPLLFFQITLEIQPALVAYVFYGKVTL